MADFGNITVTKSGAEALAYAEKGETLTITKIVLGDGRLPEGTSPEEVTALYGLKSEVEPQTREVVDPREVGADERFAAIKVGGIYKNDENLEGFDWREYGIMASTDSTGEVLYAYGNAGDHAEYIPPGKSAYLIERALDFYVVVTPDAKVELSIDSKYFVTEEHFNQKLEEFEQEFKTEISESGTAHEATAAEALKTARNIYVDLSKGDAASFDGSADVEPGVKGVLPTANGGTGNAEGKAPKAEVADKLGETTLGSSTKPIYLKDGVPKEADDYPNAPGKATEGEDGLMSKEDKAKLDKLDLEKINPQKLEDITGSDDSHIVLGNGTVQDIAAFFTAHAAELRSAIGVATKEHDGLVPKLPENPEVEE